MKTFFSIIFCLFLNLSLLYSGEIEERENIDKYTVELLQKSDYKTLSSIAKKYRGTEERALSGRLKLSFFYYKIFNSIDMVVKDKYNNNWDALEEDLLSWTKSNPNDPAFHIIYASFLTRKALMYRGGSYAKYVPKENWEPFHKEVSKAIEYLNKHKSVASQDPHWYVCMLDLAKLDSWDKISFYAFLDEAINKYPNYYPIYKHALFYLDPKWNGYTKEEIEYIGEKILNATKDKDGAYARYYLITKDKFFQRQPITILNIDWKAMEKSMERLIEKYPTQYNINSIACLSCLSNQTKIMRKYINKIDGKPMLAIWETQEAFNMCKENSEDDQNTNAIIDIILARYKFSSPSDLKNIKQKYTNAKTYKAWAITLDYKYRLYNALSTSQVSQEKANMEALKLCNIGKVSMCERNPKAFSECILYREGDKNVYDKKISLKSITEKTSNSIYKTLPLDEIKKYIEKNSTEKPIFFYFHNKHTNLIVDQQIESIGKKFEDKIDFITIENYNKLLNKDLREYFGVKNIPSFAVVYKKRIVLKYDRSYFSDYKIKSTNEQLALLIKDGKQKDYSKIYGEGIYGNLYYSFNADLTTKVNTKRYLRLKSHKAWANVIIQGYTVGDWSINQPTLKKAKENALNKCQKLKEQNNIKEECKLYMIENEYVHNQ